MHSHHFSLIRLLVVCAAAGALCATAEAAAPGSAAATQQKPSVTQSSTLTGCVQYGSGNSYVLTTLNAPRQPDLANESALESEELKAPEHSYQLIPEGNAHLSQLIGAKVRVSGSEKPASDATSMANARGAVSTSGRTSAAMASARRPAALGLDQLNVSSVQKLSNYCDPQLTMFAK